MNATDNGHAEAIFETSRRHNPAEARETGSSVDVDSVDRKPIQPWEPIPTDVLPEPLAGYVTESAAIGCDESFVFVPLLVATAGAIGNTRRAGLKRNWTEPWVLWGATVGESGSHKSPGFESGVRPGFDRQREARREFSQVYAKWAEDHAVWEQAAAEAKRTSEPIPEEPAEPTCPALWIDDCTVEAVGALLVENERGCLVAAEELAGWFGSFDAYRSGKGNDAAKWLRMFGGRELRIDRRTGTPRTLFIPHASVSVAGTIQPGILRKHLSADHRTSGMAARLLFAWPPRRATRWTEAEVDHATTEAVADLFATLYELDLWTDQSGERRPWVVPLSSEAKDLFRAFVDEHGEGHAHETGDLAAAFSKLTGYAARFALIFATVRRATGEDRGPIEEIDPVSMRDGIRLARWFTYEARRVYRLVDAGEADRDRHELAEWITRKGGEITERDLQRGRRDIKTAHDAETALTDLVTHGYGEWDHIQPGPRGGRPSRSFRLTLQCRHRHNLANAGDEGGSVDTDDEWEAT